MTIEAKLQLLQLQKQGLSYQELSDKSGWARRTVARYLREARAYEDNLRIKALYSTH